MKKVHPFMIFLMMAVLLFPSCSGEERHTENEIILGTLTEITSFSEKDRKASSDAFTVIREEEKIFDRHHEGSELFYLNENAGKEPVKASSELFSLIERALEIAELTEGAFNPAIGPLVDLWGIGTDGARVPSGEEIAETLQLIDFHDIVLDQNAETVFFEKPGMSIDLGAIAKGHISVEAALFMKSQGVEKAIINLGGNVYVVGEKSKGKPWNIGLQSPDLERGGCFTTVEASDEAVVTSGGYERFFQPEPGGPIYHHLLDSRTGYPAESDLVSTTVISSDAALADALSTALFVSGKEKAEEIVSLFGVKAVLLDNGGNVIRLGF